MLELRKVNRPRLLQLLYNQAGGGEAVSPYTWLLKIDPTYYSTL